MTPAALPNYLKSELLFLRLSIVTFKSCNCNRRVVIQPRLMSSCFQRCATVVRETLRVMVIAFGTVAKHMVSKRATNLSTSGPQTVWLLFLTTGKHSAVGTRPNDPPSKARGTWYSAVEMARWERVRTVSHLDADDQRQDLLNRRQMAR
jgi:hypothetical protein